MVGKEKQAKGKIFFRGKKAYVKTLEAVIAMVLTFAFILYILPLPEYSVKSDTNGVLISLLENEEFRLYAVNISSCFYKQQNESITVILDEELKGYLNYSICPLGTLPSLPRKKVNVESLYLTGNITNPADKVVRLYYWE